MHMSKTGHVTVNHKTCKRKFNKKGNRITKPIYINSLFVENWLNRNRYNMAVYDRKMVHISYLRIDKNIPQYSYFLINKVYLLSPKTFIEAGYIMNLKQCLICVRVFMFEYTRLGVIPRQQK